MNHFRFDICPCCSLEKEKNEDSFGFDFSFSGEQADFVALDIAKKVVKEIADGKETSSCT